MIEEKRKIKEHEEKFTHRKVVIGSTLSRHILGEDVVYNKLGSHERGEMYDQSSHKARVRFEMLLEKAKQLNNQEMKSASEEQVQMVNPMIYDGYLVHG